MHNNLWNGYIRIVWKYITEWLIDISIHLLAPNCTESWSLQRTITMVTITLKGPFHWAVMYFILVLFYQYLCHSFSVALNLSSFFFVLFGPWIMSVSLIRLNASKLRLNGMRFASITKFKCDTHIHTHIFLTLNLLLSTIDCAFVLWKMTYK